MALDTRPSRSKSPFILKGDEGSEIIENELTLLLSLKTIIVMQESVTFRECSVVLLVLAVSAGGGRGEGHQVANGDEQGGSSHNQGDQGVGG